jgi:MFS family permease
MVRIGGRGGGFDDAGHHSIISGSYEGERRAFALGIISSMASGAGTIGPIIGGFFDCVLQRYAFGLELVVMVIILLFSREIAAFPPIMKWSDFNLSPPPLFENPFESIVLTYRSYLNVSKN